MAHKRNFNSMRGRKKRSMAKHHSFPETLTRVHLISDGLATIFQERADTGILPYRLKPKKS